MYRFNVSVVCRNVRRLGGEKEKERLEKQVEEKEPNISARLRLFKVSSNRHKHMGDRWNQNESFACVTHTDFNVQWSPWWGIRWAIITTARHNVTVTARSENAAAALPHTLQVEMDVKRQCLTNFSAFITCHYHSKGLLLHPTYMFSASGWCVFSATSGTWKSFFLRWFQQPASPILQTRNSPVLRQCKRLH